MLRRWLTDDKHTSSRPHSSAWRPVPADPARTSPRCRDGYDIDPHIRSPSPASPAWPGQASRRDRRIAGLGLTPVTPAQAQSSIGGDNVLGSDI